MIGLSLMDDELRRILTHNDFLKKLIDELKEDIEDILTPKGKQLYKAVLPEEAASSSTAYVDSQPDNPVTEPNDDKLGRKEFAEFLVQLLNTTSLRMGAYALHIFAPWGFGKTSVFNFMKTIMNRDRLKDGKPRWVYVDFNAWQNQHLTHPWWTLMNTIYQNVKKHLSWRFRLKEWWWRFSSSKLHYLIGIGVLTWLVALLVIPLYKTTRSVDDISKIFENIGKVVAGVLAV